MTEVKTIGELDGIKTKTDLAGLIAKLRADAKLRPNVEGNRLLDLKLVEDETVEKILEQLCRSAMLTG